MKFLHTADWHLGKTLNGISFHEDQEHILTQLTQVIKDQKPDVILLAGDIYDRSVPPVNAVRLFDNIIEEWVLSLKIPVIAIAGNHDSADRLNYANNLVRQTGFHITGNINSFDCSPVILKDKYGDVAFHSLPYTEPAHVRSWASWQAEQDSKEQQEAENEAAAKSIMNSHEAVNGYFCEAVFNKKYEPSTRHVLIGHAFVAGSSETDSERDLALSVGGATQVPARIFEKFNYVAQGHLHRYQSFNDGKGKYSGSPLKYSFSEHKDVKGCIVGELDDKGQPHTNFIALTPQRDVRRISGCINAERVFVPDAAFENTGKHDLLEVTLTNQNLVLNAAAIIKEQFPNTIKIPAYGQREDVLSHLLTREQREDKSEVEHFEMFWRQYKESPLTENQIMVLADLLKETE